jgi:hypothetical protein
MCYLIIETPKLLGEVSTSREQVVGDPGLSYVTTPIGTKEPPGIPAYYHLTIATIEMFAISSASLASKT